MTEATGPADTPEPEDQDDAAEFPTACTSMHEHDPVTCAPESPLAMLTTPAAPSTWTMSMVPADPGTPRPTGEITVTVSDFPALLDQFRAAGLRVWTDDAEPGDGPAPADGLPFYAGAAGSGGVMLFRRAEPDSVPADPGSLVESEETPDRYDVRTQRTPAGMAYGVLDTVTGNIAHTAFGIETAGWYDDRTGARAAADQLSAAWRAIGGWESGPYLPPSASVIVRTVHGPEKWTGARWNEHVIAAETSGEGINVTIIRWS